MWISPELKRGALASYIVGSMLFGQTKPASAPSSDLEIWSELDLSANLSHRCSILVPLVARNSSAFPNPVLAGTGLLMIFSMTPHVSLTGGYLFVDLPNTDAGYRAHVPLAAVTYNQKLGRIEISDRNRGERLIGIPGDPFRYRNRLGAELPVGSGQWSFLVNDEVFYDFGTMGWNQNRLQVGARRTLSRRISLYTYFLDRRVHASGTRLTHGFGFALDASLR